LLSPAATYDWQDTHIVSQVIVSQPDQTMRVLWSRVPFSQTVVVPALSADADLVDMWGNRSALSTSEGTYKIHLSAGECTQTVGDYCMIGGPPLFLIESMPLETDSNQDLNIVIVDEAVGSDFSEKASALSHLPVYMMLVLVSLGMMSGTVWLSHYLRLELNSFGEKN